GCRPRLPRRLIHAERPETGRSGALRVTGRARVWRSATIVVARPSSVDRRQRGDPTMVWMGGFARNVGAVALVSCLALTARGTGAALIAGGSNPRSDCYVEFDVQGAAGSNPVECTDGDPCDTDGQ